MDAHLWQMWVIAALAAGVLEVKLSNFVMVWFGVGALASALAAAAGLSLNVQLLLFTLTSVALFAASRTLFRRFLMRSGHSLQTGTEAMVGHQATVTEALPLGGMGAVRINGELWGAVSLDGAVAVGETVQVESLDGLKLKVRRPRAHLRALEGEKP